MLAMISVYPITLTLDEFAHAPEDERVFYLKLGAITNEINVLSKWSLFCINNEMTSKLISRANHTTALVALRMLAGRLYEARKVICDDFKSLKMRYHPKMKGSGRAAYKGITGYFGQTDNLIKSIRHKLAFHMSDEVFRAGLAGLEADEDLTDYMTRERGNCLFWGGEAVLIGSLIKLAKAKDAPEAYAKLLDDTALISGLVSDFTFAFSLGFYSRNFPEKLRALQNEAGREDVDAPVLTEVTMPFFCARP